MMRKTNIQNSCSENWAMMSPQEKGRFFSSCNKCVIDFTQKKPEEIRHILKEKNGKTVCSMFYNHQRKQYSVTKEIC